MNRLGARNPVSRGLDGLPVDGSLTLQVCADCAAVQYPPRELCRACLADALAWRRVDGSATVLAATTLAHSLEEDFRARLPWHVASLALDAGPVVFAHIEARHARSGIRLRVANATDARGAWCLVAFDAAARDPLAALQATLHTLGMHA